MGETWRNNTALLWKRSNNKLSCYWDQPLDGGSDDHLPANVDDGLCRLSYRKFLHLLAVLVDELREVVTKRLPRDASFSRTDQTGRTLSVAVAIAIPEGPYLPLAVTAVHALNKPFSVCQSNLLVSTILFPLDPSDEQSRAAHMLGEVRPMVILTASSIDTDRIQEIAKDLPPKGKPTSSENLFQSSNVTVIDVRKILFRTVPVGDEKLHSFASMLPILDGQYKGDNRLSHVVYTSGSTGLPKACLSSIASLQSYLSAKNFAYEISSSSTVLLVSSLTFDPCLSDILATVIVRGTLAIAPRSALIGDMESTLTTLSVSHVLCTPTVWSTLRSSNNEKGGSSHNNDTRFPYLRVVALGGEHIPKSIVTAWARKSTNDSTSNIRLYATYGVTEACVYQTVGEIVQDGSPERNVGRPFAGLAVRICHESLKHSLCDVDATNGDGIGEIVMYGNQLDSLSSYVLRPDLSAQKFVLENGVMHYRTGDRGFMNRTTGSLSVMGRIEGEDGMVKINGVRTELGGIEAALIDDITNCDVVVDAIVVLNRQQTEPETGNEVHAYIVLSRDCLDEMRITTEVPPSGIICPESPLLALLYARCKVTRVVPSIFVIIPRIPLSPTGKRHRKGVLSIDEAVPLLNVAQALIQTPLGEYGCTGHFVANEISTTLNLRRCQVELMTKTSTFAMLGGDSLTATRITRAVYARHHDIANSRLIGGEYGVLDGPFAAVHLLNAVNMGAYVDWLDSHGVFENMEECRSGDDLVAIDKSTDTSVDTTAKQLYDALLQAVATKCTNVARALLDAGADPNLGESGGRIGKISDRMERMKAFRSSPLHIACLHGSPILVKKLLEKKASCNIPNASSMFPIHLAASGEFHEASTCEEDKRRLLCIKYLLDAGTPLTIRDGSKQTILHAAARAGHLRILRFALERWVEKCTSSPNLDLRDNWSRTPVHWAVLNGKVDAVELLISMGCSSNPIKPKDSHRRTSFASESPLEICLRIYDAESAVGQRMRSILQQESSRN